MKSYALSFLLGSMLFTLSGCGSSSDSKSDSTDIVNTGNSQSRRRTCEFCLTERRSICEFFLTSESRRKGCSICLFCSLDDGSRLNIDAVVSCWQTLYLQHGRLKAHTDTRRIRHTERQTGSQRKTEIHRKTDSDKETNTWTDRQTRG